MGFAPGFPETNRRLSLTIMQQLSSSEKEASSFDMKELRERINDLYGCRIPVKGAFSAFPARDRPKPDKVHVVVFQPGTINQGAHTIEYPKGSGINVVLAFESIESCRQFAASLVEQKFVDPTPCQYRLQDLQNFFSTIGVFVQVIPDGVALKPPAQNVPKFGHNPSLYKTKQTLDYVFAMLDDDSDESDSVDTTITLSTGAWE